MTTGGTAVNLDALMESFIRFLISMTGDDKKEPVTQTIQCDVRCMIEDLLTDKPYKPRLLICILTIGDVSTGLLECFLRSQPGSFMLVIGKERAGEVKRQETRVMGYSVVKVA